MDNYDGCSGIDYWLGAKILPKLAVKYFGTLLNIVLFFGAAILVIFLIVLILKAYWQPETYTKNFTAVGFDHIKPGPDRLMDITRAQMARRMGSKLPPPYPNGWFALVDSCELTTGAVMPIDALGQNLCLYRGEDGVARCVNAYCPHLGAHLGVGGQVCGTSIECAFHQWRFGERGQLCSVPGLDTVPNGISIKTWPTVEADGAIWIWYDAEGREPMWEMKNAPELPQWGCRGRNVFYVNCHIQEIPENGADVAHLNAVHSKSLLSHYFGQHYWVAEWQKMEDHRAVVRLTQDYKIWKMNMFHLDINVTQIGPGFVRLHIDSCLGPMLISQSVTPLGPLYQKVVHRVYTPNRNAILGVIMNKAESNMLKRDIKIWNNKSYVETPAYVRTDRSIKSFRNWFSQFYSENSMSFRDAQRNNLDW